LSYKLKTLIDLAILNILISCVCKIILNYYLTTVKLLLELFDELKHITFHILLNNLAKIYVLKNLDTTMYVN